MKLKRFVFLADSFVNYKLIKISNFQEIDGSKCRSDIENDATPGTSSGKVQKAIDLQQNQLLWKNAYKKHFPEEKELVWEELSQIHSKRVTVNIPKKPKIIAKLSKPKKRNSRAPFGVCFPFGILRSSNNNATIP